MSRKLLLLALVFIFGVLVIILSNRNRSEIVYLARVKQISTSGETRFYWYDSKLKRIIAPDNQYSWFWAMPENVPSDSKATNEWVAKIKSKQDSVFKITGVRGKDDCEYFDAQHCIQSIKVRSIEIVK